MISEDTRAKYTATIGIECHVQLKTKTKLFTGVDNDAAIDSGNSRVDVQTRDGRRIREVVKDDKVNRAGDDLALGVAHGMRVEDGGAGGFVVSDSGNFVGGRERGNKDGGIGGLGPGASSERTEDKQKFLHIGLFPCL